MSASKNKTESTEVTILRAQVEVLLEQIPTDAEFIGLRSVVYHSDGEPSEQDGHNAASYLDRAETLRKKLKSGSAKSALDSVATLRWRSLKTAPLNTWVFGRRLTGRLPSVVRCDERDGSWYDSDGTVSITHWFPIPTVE